MRYSLKEGVLFGVIIAVAVLLIRAFVGGPLLSQLLALIVVAVVLAIAQLLLGLRRAHPRDQNQTAAPLHSERTRNPRRDRPQDPFAREKNQAWTGLSSTTVQEQEQRERAGAAPSETPSSAAPQRTPESPRDVPPPTNHHRS